MQTSEQIAEIATALAAAQGAMKPAIKDSVNPVYRSKYADLAANVEAAREALAAQKLAVVQEATLGERGVSVGTLIAHASGQWIRFDPLTVPLAKPDAHGVGSATSYARRYALGAALGLVAEDDDGNAATRQTPTKAADPTPAGYGVWWATMQAIAQQGSGPLQQAWKVALPEYRQIVTRQYAQEWEALKAEAAKAKATAA